VASPISCRLGCLGILLWRPEAALGERQLGQRRPFADVGIPRFFYDGWVRVEVGEAGHFHLQSGRLCELGAAYGNLPARDGYQRADVQRRRSGVATGGGRPAPLAAPARGAEALRHRECILDRLLVERVAHARLDTLDGVDREPRRA
jgi:hypothetical protein